LNDTVVELLNFGKLEDQIFNYDFIGIKTAHLRN